MRTKNIVEYLLNIKERVHVFITPATPQMLECFISGLVRGYLIDNESLNFETYSEVNRKVISSRGWQIKAVSPYKEMRDRNMSDEEIIQELLSIEIETWQRLG